MADDILNLSLDDIIANKSKKPSGLKSDKPGTRTIGKKDEAGRSRGRRYEERLKVTASDRGLKRGATGKRGSGVRILEVSRGQPDVPTAPRNPAALDGNAAWEHDLYDDGPPIQTKRIRPAQSGFKLLIRNLDYKVSSDDIRELFENCGTLKKAHVLFDRSDRSTEEAEVIFERRDDAVAALKQYNNLALDNKPMQITLIEDEGTAAGGRTLSSGIRIGGQRAVPTARVSSVRMRVGRARPGGMITRDSNRGISGGGRQARGRGPAISQEDLDKDLDSYMATD